MEDGYTQEALQTEDREKELRKKLQVNVQVKAQFKAQVKALNPKRCGLFGQLRMRRQTIFFGDSNFDTN